MAPPGLCWTAQKWAFLKRLCQPGCVCRARLSGGWRPPRWLGARRSPDPAFRAFPGSVLSAFKHSGLTPGAPLPAQWLHSEVGPCGLWSHLGGGRGPEQTPLGDKGPAGGPASGSFTAWAPRGPTPPLGPPWQAGNWCLAAGRGPLVLGRGPPVWWALTAPPKHVVGGFAGVRAGLSGRGSHTRGELPSAREPLSFGAHLGLVGSRTGSSRRMLTVWPQTRISCLPTGPLGWGWFPHCLSLPCLSPEPSLLPPLRPLLRGTSLSVHSTCTRPRPRAGTWAFRAPAAH